MFFFPFCLQIEIWLFIFLLHFLFLEFNLWLIVIYLGRRFIYFYHFNFVVFLFLVLTSFQIFTHLFKVKQNLLLFLPELLIELVLFFWYLVFSLLVILLTFNKMMVVHVEVVQAIRALLFFQTACFHFDLEGLLLVLSFFLNWFHLFINWKLNY